MGKNELLIKAKQQICDLTHTLYEIPNTFDKEIDTLCDIEDKITAEIIKLSQTQLELELEATNNDTISNEQTKRIEKLEYCTDKLINKLLEINSELTETQIKLEEVESQYAYECECNKQLVELQNKLKEYKNKERQDVIDEIKFNEDIYKKEFNFTEKEIDKIVELYKEFLGEDTRWNKLVNKAIQSVIDEREHKVYEVHTLYEDGTTKFRYNFQTMTDAIKYYNSLDNISKELVINTNDEKFNTIYGYYAENNIGISKIDIIKLGGLKND